MEHERVPIISVAPSGDVFELKDWEMYMKLEFCVGIVIYL